VIEADGVHEIASLIAERWNQATPDEKQRYLEKREESKEL